MLTSLPPCLTVRSLAKAIKMTVQIALVFFILAVAVVLFVTERLRVDVVALLVLAALVLAGLITPIEALSGFSNPAVITVGAVLVLSAGLSRTGVANVIGRHVLRLSGQGEARLLIAIMLTTAVLSAFMNDIGVAALLLPVVVSIARRTGLPPSKLLIPLAFGALLGGLNTLIGTPPNILISEALRQYDLRPFQMFDYALVGLPLTITGIAFITIIGRRMLPVRDIAAESPDPSQAAREQLFDFRKQVFVVRVAAGSNLIGRALAESRLGSALGLNVIGIIRNGRTQLAPDPTSILQAGDRLLVAGSPDQVSKLRGREQLIFMENELAVESIISSEIDLAEISLSPRSGLLGQTLDQINFRRRFGVNVLAIWSDGLVKRTNLQTIPLKLGDVLLVQGRQAQLDMLRDSPDFLVSSAEAAEIFSLHERLLVIGVPQDSTLVGKSLAESHLGDAFGLTVLGIIRDGTTQLMPEPATMLSAGDTLLVEGKLEDMMTLRGLQELELESEEAPELPEFTSQQVGTVEAVLSPYSSLHGQTLRQIRFREKYGLSVLAIWHEGRASRVNLRDIPIRFGDALFLYGSWDKLKALSREPDFIVLAEEVQEPPLIKKAPIALVLMGGVLLTVVLGWLPIAIAALIGATLMVVTGCLQMDEAYRSIEWKAVFLIACMLPLGIAMERSGAAQLMAETMVATVGGIGPMAVVAGFFILTTIATQVMPNPAAAVLLAPIAINTAQDLQMSPYALMMTVALAASAAFLSPVAHPVNVLVMGPGGYRFADYIRVGLPLSLVVLLVLLLVLPIFWPLYP